MNKLNTRRNQMEIEIQFFKIYFDGNIILF